MTAVKQIRVIRSQAVAHMERYLLRRGLPRFQMLVIVIATGLAGFGASAALLGLGVSSIAVRYLLAVLAAYAAFLLLVRLWAEYQHRRLEPDSGVIDVIVDLVPPAGGGIDPEPAIGGGGQFGGGGTGGGWEQLPEQPPIDVLNSGSPAIEAMTCNTEAVSSGGSSGGLPFDLDLDDGWIIVVPVLVLVGAILVAAYVVYAAPALLAEVLVDVLLVSGLYRRLRRIESEHWLNTAVRKTWIPIAIVAVVFTVGGFAMQKMVPQADSIGDIIALIRK